MKILMYLGLFPLLFLTASPVLASSYAVSDVFVILAWFMLNNIIEIGVVLIIIFCAYSIYRFSRGKSGFYLYVSEDSIWVAGAYIEREKTDEIAQKYGLEDYVLLLDGEPVEYESSVLASPGASYELVRAVDK